MTNAEKIKGMNKDELANFLIRISRDFKFANKEDAHRFLNADEYLFTKEFTLNDSKEYIRRRVLSAYKLSDSLPPNMSVDRFFHFLFLDTSDIFQRCSDEPYSKVLLDICVELWLRREGYVKTADNYSRQNKW